MRNVTFDQCDSTEEICGLFNKVFANQEQMEGKILQLSKRVEALEPIVVPKVEDVIMAKPKKKGRTMKKGFALTRVLAVLMLVAAIAGLCYTSAVYAAYIPTDITFEIADNPELLATYLRDVTGTMISDSYLFTPTLPANAPPLAEGRVWYDTTANALMLSVDGLAWTTIAAAGGNSLDAAYNLSEAITVDATAVTLTVPLAAANPALILVSNDTTSDPDVLVIDQNSDLATVTAVQIDSVTGYDIRGTADTWYVSYLGVGTYVGLAVGATDITLENGGVINNTTDNEIEFIENAEEFSFAFNGNTLTLATDTGIDTLEYGVVDDANGLGNIYFDSAASQITLAANQDADDLLVQVTGALNATLDLRSAGTGDDAIIARATAGGIDVDAVKSIVITSVENTADSIVIQSTLGGIDIRADAAGAAEDIDITNTGGSVNIAATEDAAAAITLTTNGGTTETIVVTNTQGEGADSITVVSTAGGIDIDAALGITIDNAGAASDIVLTSALGSIGLSASEDATDAINIDSTAGGIDIDAVGEAGQDIVITNTGGSVQIVATEAAALDAFNLDVTGAISGVDVDTTNGPIVLTAANADNGDITLVAADVMTFTSVDTKVFDGAATELWNITGTAAGGFEHIISFTDATADITWTFPDGGTDILAIMGSTLATNYPDIANSVTGGTNQLIFEGAGVDAHEAIITATDPTADIIWILPDGGADSLAVMGSTLETNYPEVVNSVTGASNSLIFEGTADAFETILTANDATVADKTLTLPNDDGDVVYAPAGGTTYGAGAGAIPVTHVYVAYTSVGGAEALTLADGQDGQVIVINHVVDGGNGVLTPATAAGWTSIDLADAGDTVSCIFVNTVGWAILGTSGNAAPPVVTP